MCAEIPATSGPTAAIYGVIAGTSAATSTISALTTAIGAPTGANYGTTAPWDRRAMYERIVGTSATIESPSVAMSMICVVTDAIGGKTTKISIMTGVSVVATSRTDARMH